MGLGAPTAGAALEQVTVVQQPVQHSADRGGVAQQFAPSSTGRLEVTRVLTHS